MDRSWGSDDWLAEREQHRADEDAERRHEATHEDPEPGCWFCNAALLAALLDAAQDAADEEERTNG